MTRRPRRTCSCARRAPAVGPCLLRALSAWVRPRGVLDVDTFAERCRTLPWHGESAAGLSCCRLCCFGRARRRFGAGRPAGHGRQNADGQLVRATAAAGHAGGLLAADVHPGQGRALQGAAFGLLGHAWRALWRTLTARACTMWRTPLLVEHLRVACTQQSMSCLAQPEGREGASRAYHLRSLVASVPRAYGRGEAAAGCRPGVSRSAAGARRRAGGAAARRRAPRCRTTAGRTRWATLRWAWARPPCARATSCAG